MPVAVLYLPTPSSHPLSDRPVAGRSLTLRLMMAAARAGVTTIGVPAALRTKRLERELRRAPALVGCVRFIDGHVDDPPFTDEPCLLVPAAALVDTASLRALLAEGPDPAGAVLAGTSAAGAPVLLAPPSLVAKVWHGLAGGEALGDELVRAVAVARPAAVTAGAPPIVVRDESDLARAEARLYAAIGTDADTGVDTFLHRRCSIHITRLLVRTPATPNQVSLASFLVGTSAIWCFWHATPWSAPAGVLLYAAACILDHSDGELARLTFQESPLGAHLDWAIDTIIHSMLVLAMAVSAGGGPIVLAIGALGAVGVTLSALFARHLPREIEVGPSVGGILKNTGNRDLFYLLLLLFVLFRWAVPPLLPALAVVVAAGSQSYWVACLARIRKGRAGR
ncbi:MAG TPA: CDP-alcohol phosphatidyltransferase family protein [Candidatus Limnocylindrales bacterium]|nr:CDP-alcohol phosphatidyltransferase family protein [Candidatus Limnocylindrales bacterium]